MKNKRGKTLPPEAALFPQLPKLPVILRLALLSLTRCSTLACLMLIASAADADPDDQRGIPQDGRACGSPRDRGLPFHPCVVRVCRQAEIGHRLPLPDDEEGEARVAGVAQRPAAGSQSRGPDRVRAGMRQVHLQALEGGPQGEAQCTSPAGSAHPHGAPPTAASLLLQSLPSLGPTQVLLRNGDQGIVRRSWLGLHAGYDIRGQVPAPPVPAMVPHSQPAASGVEMVALDDTRAPQMSPSPRSTHPQLRNARPRAPLHRRSAHPLLQYLQQQRHSKEGEEGSQDEVDLIHTGTYNPYC